MKKYLLGIDIGTSSIKVAVVDSDLHVISLVTKEYSVEYKEKNYASIRMSVLWESFLKCLTQLKEQEVAMDRICGIGLSCMCPGLVAIGDNREFLSEVILYSDRRSTEEEQLIKDKIGVDKIFEVTANNMMSGAISCTSMLWIKRNHPEIYEKTRCFGHLNTAFSVMLTGNAAIDPSNASYTGLFNTGTDRQWSSWMCEQIGIDISLLPKIIKSDQCSGALDAPEVIDFGIPAGIPVVIGGADTPCGSVASGVVKAGDICESIGTTDVLTACIDEPKFGKEFINRCHAVDGRWIYQGAMSNTGTSMQWCLNTICKDLLEKAEMDGEKPIGLLDMEADKSVPGANGVVFLPYLAGERSPIWDSKATGVFYGLTGNTRREDMVRAVMESNCYGMRQLVEICEALTGRSYESIDLIGGGAKSLFWSQLKANIIGKKVRVLENNNAAVIGAAMLAGVGAGLFQTVEEASELMEYPVFCELEPKATEEELAVYNKRYNTYVDLYRNIKPVFSTNY